jgi:hypothetical protein
MKRVLITIVLSIFPAVLFAQDQGRYQCTIGELSRRVETLYETGVTVPCEVHYYKDTEMPGERQVLWRAANEEGYCEARTAELIEKLRGMGWTCLAAGAEDELGETDDTDALAPAEEIELPEADIE